MCMCVPATRLLITFWSAVEHFYVSKFSKAILSVGHGLSISNKTCHKVIKTTEGMYCYTLDFPPACYIYMASCIITCMTSFSLYTNWVVEIILHVLNKSTIKFKTCCRKWTVWRFRVLQRKEVGSSSIVGSLYQWIGDLSLVTNPEGY